MSRTFLTVTYREKDAAKALGARWDSLERKWYVPEGFELAPFTAWLPTRSSALTETGSLLPLVEDARAQRGISLSQLLNGVSRAVAAAYSEAVWTTAEVLRVSAKDGHVYLELSERSADGRVVVKAQAAIWARTAEQVVPEFERATGAILAAGIKLLVRARPVFKPQYGFSLEIDGIDPTYTLGDLEAKKREIRERLKREGLFGQNKALEPPWDFARVLVVSPEAAAGLGDFAKEAARLARFEVCHFEYVHCRFQGESAAAEIRSVLLAGLAGQRVPVDAVIVIRGGGAVNDLAWLNDYDLARAICECPVPVLTGIGHERDNTVLDEVAHQRFDTPSKVVAGIEQRIAVRAREAQNSFDAVVDTTSRVAERVRALAERLEREVQTSSTAALATARGKTAELVTEVRHAAQGAFYLAHRNTSERLSELRHGAFQALLIARQTVPSAIESVLNRSQMNLRQARRENEAALPAVLARTGAALRQTTSDVETTMASLGKDAQSSVASASRAAESLLREIAGQGPDKTLRRGFAVVRTAEGSTVTTARAAQSAVGPLEIAFADGVALATVERNRRTVEYSNKDASK